MTKWLYIRSSIKKYFLNYASLRSDFYLCSSFWAGFGWLEIPMQHAFLLWPKVLVPIFLLATSVRSAYCATLIPSKIQAYASIFMIMCLGGAVLAIAMLANAYYDQSVNLHGRYLIGIEIMLIISSVIYFASAGFNLSHKNSVPLLLLVICVARAVTFKFILNRYF